MDPLLILLLLVALACPISMLLMHRHMRGDHKTDDKAPEHARHADQSR